MFQPHTITLYIGRERLSLPRPQLPRLGAGAAAFTAALFFGLDMLADEITPHDHDH